MRSEEFKELYQKLNPNQRQAVDAIDGAVMVVAGPGTGKTQVLTLRIANILLKTDVEPENILALTFTEAAAANMRARLVKMIGNAGFRVRISTFHSFCNEIIRDNPEDFPQHISSENLTELEQIELIEKIVLSEKLTLLKPFGDQLYYVQSLGKAIDQLKREGITVDDLVAATNKQKADFDLIEDLYHEKGAYKGEMKGKYQELQREIAKNEELAIVYQKYQQGLIDQKRYDFNDMLLEVLQILRKNKSLLLRLQEKYQYVLVDEHQDTNNAQNRIVELLCSFYENPNLFVVGDEKQAIFRFQGATLENFIYFKQLYPQAVLINLTDNYRSNQTVLDAAASVISQNATTNVLFPEGNELKALSGINNHQIQIAELSDFYSEYYFIAEEIEKLIKQEVVGGEVAVIGRNNKDLQTLAGVLEKKAIKFSVDIDSNVFADPQVQKLVLLLKAIANFGDDAALMTALHIDFLGCSPLDVYKLIRLSQQKRQPLIEIIADLDKVGIVLDKPDCVKSFYDKLNIWSAMAHNDSFENLYVKVLDDSNLTGWVLGQNNAVEILDKLTGIFEDIKLQSERKPGFSINDFLAYVDLLAKHQLNLKRHSKTIFPNAVRLMTAHKSKGLEFDYVFIINAFDGHWGNLRRRSQPFKLPWEYLGIKLKLDVELDQNEDERRLFYVSITRARKQVMISYSTRSLDGKEQIPSQFISEINDSFKESVNVSDFEKEFIAHKEVVFQPTFNHPKPLIADQEFLVELFKDRGLSVTALNNYLECPWRWFYRNLLQLPDVKTKSLIFGSAVHAALSNHIKLLKEGKPSEKQLIAAFEESIKQSYLLPNDEEELILKGQKVLPGYYQQILTKFGDNLSSEMKIRGIELTDQVFLNGAIDVVEYLDSVGNIQNVRVYDFKTGKPKSRNEVSGDNGKGGDYKRQLLFYKILVDNYQPKKLRVTEGVIDFVEPDAKGKYHREVFDLTEGVEELEQLIKNVADEIVNLKFWQRRCDDPECRYCPLREMMAVN